MQRSLFLCLIIGVLTACAITGDVEKTLSTISIKRVEFLENSEGYIEFATNSATDPGYSFYYDSGFSEEPLTSVTVELQRMGGLSTCGLLFAYRDLENFYLLEFGADRRYRIWKMATGSYIPLSDWVSTTYLTSKIDQVTISFDGTDLYSIYFNSSPAITFRDNTSSGGGLYYFVDVSQEESFPAKPLRLLFKKI